jgi:hypothetical protein
MSQPHFLGQDDTVMAFPIVVRKNIPIEEPEPDLDPAPIEEPRHPGEPGPAEDPEEQPVEGGPGQR